MSYASILQLIQERLLGEDTLDFWTEKGITRPTAVIPWENNATAYNEREGNPQPPRPYVAVEFADLPMVYSNGSKSGSGRFNIKVVVDNFSQGRNNSQDKADYVANLDYAGHIDELLDFHQGILTQGFQKPIYANNLLIQTIPIKVTVVNQRQRLEWKK